MRHPVSMWAPELWSNYGARYTVSVPGLRMCLYWSICLTIPPSIYLGNSSALLPPAHPLTHIFHRLHSWLWLPLGLHSCWVRLCDLPTSNLLLQHRDMLITILGRLWISKSSFNGHCEIIFLSWKNLYTKFTAHCLASDTVAVSHLSPFLGVHLHVKYYAPLISLHFPKPIQLLTTQIFFFIPWRFCSSYVQFKFLLAQKWVQIFSRWIASYQDHIVTM